MASVVCAAGLLVFIGAQALELGQHYKSRQARLIEADARFQELEILQKQHPDLETYQMEIENQRRYVDQLLPDRIESSALMARLQQYALKSGLELRELLPGETAKNQAATTLPLQIRVAGDYFGLLDFIKSLENGTPYCRITAMELEQKNDILTAMLQVNVYSL